MLKVVWNKKRTWKILKFYKEGKLKKIKYNGDWYHPVFDYSCFDYDDSGNRYIACDGCDNCFLEKVCKGDNPIYEACGEFNKLSIHLEPCLPPNKKPKVPHWLRNSFSKEEVDLIIGEE